MIINDLLENCVAQLEYVGGLFVKFLDNLNKNDKHKQNV